MRTLHRFRPVLPAFAACLAMVAVLVVPGVSEAQVIVYDASGGNGAYPAPMPQPQPETYGHLVGRTAFYGRISLGLASDFLGIREEDATEGVLLVSGPALHTDFSLGVRFAFIHALSFDFDFDRGFLPQLDGNPIEGGRSFVGSMGASYTNYLTGSGLYVGAGLGLGIAWAERTDDYGDTYSTGTGLGLSVLGRIGYDWTLGRRSHFGISGNARYYHMLDEESFRWRGVGIAAAGTFSWY